MKTQIRSSERKFAPSTLDCRLPSQLTSVATNATVAARNYRIQMPRHESRPQVISRMIRLTPDVTKKP